MSRAEILAKLIAERSHMRVGDARIFPWTDNQRKSQLAPDTRATDRKPPVIRRDYEHLDEVRSYRNPVARFKHVANHNRVHTTNAYNRPNFQTPSPISRAAGLVQADYSASPEDVAEGGVSKIFTKPLNVRHADPSDVEWIHEKKRLEEQGRPNDLPFGRNQRTVTRSVVLVDEFAKNIQNTHDLKTKLDVLNQAVGAGITKSKSGMAAIGAQLGKILIQNIDLNKLTGSQLNEIYNKVRGMHIKDWMTEGFSHRFWSQSQYKKNQLKIVMYLISRVLATTKTPNTPILKFEMDGKSNKLNMTTVKNVSLAFLNSIDSKGAPAKTVADVKQATPRNIRYIDLQTGGVVPLKYVISQVRAGVDKGEMNELIMTAAPKPGKRDLIPVGIMSPKWAANNTTQEQAQRWAVDFFAQDKMIVVDTKTGNNVPFRIMPPRKKKPTPTPSPAKPPIKKIRLELKIKGDKPRSALIMGNTDDSDFLVDTADDRDIINAIWHSDLAFLSGFSILPRDFREKFVKEFPIRTYLKYPKIWRNNPALGSMTRSFVKKTEREL